jgi:hypothetical protein
MNDELERVFCGSGYPGKWPGGSEENQTMKNISQDSEPICSVSTFKKKTIEGTGSTLR